MSGIKQRRLNELHLSSHPDLHVGDCVPFYFCPRSVMLYLIYQGNHPETDLSWRAGPIIHLRPILRAVVAWANAQPSAGRSPCRTRVRASSRTAATSRSSNEIDWNAVQARDWRAHKEGKQAEFLLEQRFPWHLVERIGVHSRPSSASVNALPAHGHRPPVEVRPDWYY
jgi:hypothetical protein